MFRLLGEVVEFVLFTVVCLGSKLACLILLFLLADSETALADLALDLLRLLLMDHWSWLGMENIQKIFHLLFGTLIQR